MSALLDLRKYGIDVPETKPKMVGALIVGQCTVNRRHYLKLREGDGKHTVVITYPKSLKEINVHYCSACLPRVALELGIVTELEFHNLCYAANAEAKLRNRTMPNG